MCCYRHLTIASCLNLCCCVLSCVVVCLVGAIFTALPCSDLAFLRLAFSQYSFGRLYAIRALPVCFLHCYVSCALRQMHAHYISCVNFSPQISRKRLSRSSLSSKKSVKVLFLPLAEIFTRLPRCCCILRSSSAV